MRVDRGTNSDGGWAVAVGGGGFPANRYIIVDGDMNVTGTACFDDFLVRDAARADYDGDGDVDEVDLSIRQGEFGVGDGADADLEVI